jgi:hypothetical protein
MQRLIFEHSPAFILLCLAAGVGFAWVLYNRKHSWGRGVNSILFAVRALGVALLAFLLVGPIIKLTNNIFEQPTVVFLLDNSLSVRESLDSTARQQLVSNIQEQSKRLEEEDFAVTIRGLAGDNLAFTHPGSDINGALRSITNDFEGRNLAGIVLVSDGIYNSGPSPLYTSLRVPVHTVGVGDTTERVDASIRNVAYNKIAYQGNRFPMRAEVLVKGQPGQDVSIRVSRGGKVIATQSENAGTKALVDFDFQLDADNTGMQRIDIDVDPIRNESNRRNNHQTVFVEVVEGKKKILLIAPAPHPDIKAIRSVIEKNSNYEFKLHIPGVSDAAPASIVPANVDLVIFSQVFDLEGKLQPYYQQFQNAPTGMLLMVGAKSNLRQFNNQGVPIVFENFGQKDEVTPAFNNTFRDFAFAEGMSGVVSAYPPVTVPFGKFTFPPEASILLHQRIGSVTTNRPLLFSFPHNSRRVGVLLGEGIWRWRLNEYAETEKSEAFDEMISKLVQYLSTREDKRKFRSFPVRNEFPDSEPVVFESQVYNDLFEPVYGNTIDIDITDEKGKTTSYSYTTSASGSRYRIGGLREGIYRYRARTSLPTGREEVRGEFLVTGQNIESQNLTADFDLLRKLSAETGGKFYQSNEVGEMIGDLDRVEARSIIHSDESFHPMINLKAVFFLLLFLISFEWFVRKYFGSY